MKTCAFKNTLFDYFNSKITSEYPELATKIFRERLKINRPDYPYIVMKSGERLRINKRFEEYETEAGKNIRVQYRLPITFEVHDLKEIPLVAEEFTDNFIDVIEQFFINEETTHIDLRNKGIVINELLCSGVRDTSSTAVTSQEFVKEIDIVFEFEDVRIIKTTPAKELEADIQVMDKTQSLK